MSSKIVPLLPRHTVYVEPFAGGAAVMFAKPWPPATNTHHYREVLNDIRGDVVNLYRVIGDPVKGPQLVRELQATPYSRQAHKAARLIGDDASDVARAWAFYTNVQQSFSNILTGGWGTGVYGRNLAATWVRKVSRLPDYLDRMFGVHVECDDALAVIERWDSPQTLFYCDPPYPGTDLGHYGGYMQDDFSALCDLLDRCSGSFVLSCYDSPAAREHWERFEFSANASSSMAGKAGKGRDKSRAATAEELGNRKRTEVVWRADRSDNARKEIQEVWRKWGWAKGQPMPGK